MSASTILRAFGAFPQESAECVLVAQHEARTLAGSAQARAAFEMEMLASELSGYFRTWIAFDQQADEEQRGGPADAIRALLGVLRNAIFEDETNQRELLAHWDAVAGLLAHLMPFERMSDPTRASH